jgi:cyclopropane fatty-acyl-phospholipid synthase-like methyltransferase
MDSYQTTKDGFNKLASAYQEKFMDLELYNDSYDLFLAQLKQGASVLDIGCGPGNISRYLLAKRPDLVLTGIDVAPEMIRLASLNNPSGKFKVMDARELSGLTERFDGIICGFCLPYLSKEDCARLIRDCASLLHDGGVLYLSAIEGDHSQSGYESSSNGESKAYVYYHEADDIKEELQANQFTLLELMRKEYQKTPTELSTHIIFIAKKKGDV